MIENRTIWTGDNLYVMRSMEADSIDLIYLDPPFNSNHDYSAPIGSEAAGAAFKDTWTLQDIDETWIGLIAEAYPALYSVIQTAGQVNGDSDKSYLVYMAVRVMEMRRLLKPTGSIYLHCDPTMSHSIKLMMDAIFDHGNFRNEIIWFKGFRGTPRQKRYQQEHDTLFFYSNGDYTWNKIYGEYKDKKMSRYNKIDDQGRKYALIKRKRTSGEVYYGRTYPKGKLQGDVIEIPTLASTDKERTGYPTQKPLALLERIIKASSSKDDVVLDPFCGCATTCVAAEKLQRQWIGIDISPKALELVKKRLQSQVHVGDYALLGDVIHRTEIPKPIERKSKNIRHALYHRQDGKCAACKDPRPIQKLETDHIMPKSKGGQDIDSNLQLLCGWCNRTKGDRTMDYLFERLKEEGLMNE